MDNPLSILCGQHAKEPDMCMWVIDNCDPSTTSITEQLWLAAAKQRLVDLGIVYDRKK